MTNFFLAIWNYIVSKLKWDTALDDNEVMTATPSVSPQEPDTAPSIHIQSKSTLERFCDGITQMEGANPLNNNPGNCRCSPVGYAPMYGKVKCSSHGFAIFPTKELGRTYLENLVHHRVNLHPNWSFYDFFSNYAPSNDGNNPKHYAEWMATWCSTVPTTKLHDLFA